MIDKRIGRTLVIAALLAFGGTGVAQAAVTLDTKTFVESFIAASDGTMERKLKPADLVVPADRLVYVISYRNTGRQPVSDFVISNPISSSVEFIGEESSGAEMSIDGGKSFGQLVNLRVRGANGTQRAARRSDVTDIRWRLPGAIAPGASGQVTFKARLK
jgi:uncharacterized repeat protein (TIGR01451 family)